MVENGMVSIGFLGNLNPFSDGSIKNNHNIEHKNLSYKFTLRTELYEKTDFNNSIIEHECPLFSEY